MNISNEYRYRATIMTLKQALMKERSERLALQKELIDVQKINTDLAAKLLANQIKELSQEHTELNAEMNSLVVELEQTYGVRIEQINWETGEIGSQTQTADHPERPGRTSREVATRRAAGAGPGAADTTGAQATHSGRAGDAGSAVVGI
jgi:hypothetical protein